ncbi:hypothetical protein Taro_000695 [Colocasia esculenta]|uniref:Uncharacterized protein n=1 Tax=Colocasia esculenta TaxID=4460 RepID=A0A843TFM3_COLES|nr:hypothetical protein [Colocasia esculenta]
MMFFAVEKKDILSRFHRESERDPENVSIQYLRDIVLNFVVAGKDTTGGTLAWFLYMLCKQSEPKLPESLGNLTKLVALHAVGTDIKRVPDGVGNLRNLRTLLPLLRLRNFKTLAYAILNHRC